jgi:hypothetical protein
MQKSLCLKVIYILFSFSGIKFNGQPPRHSRNSTPRQDHIQLS